MLGDAEVEHLSDLLVVTGHEENVLWLQVAVHHANGAFWTDEMVRPLQRASDRRQETHQLA